jgi:hypothetical protein
VLGKIRWGLDLAMFCTGLADPTQRLAAASPAPLKELRAPIDHGVARSAVSVVFHPTSIMPDYRPLCRLWGGAFRVRPMAGLKRLRVRTASPEARTRLAAFAPARAVAPTISRQTARSPDRTRHRRSRA